MARAVRRHGVGQVQPIGRSRAGRALEGVVGGQGDERPRALAALGHPVVGDVLVHRQRIQASGGRQPPDVSLPRRRSRPRRQPAQFRLLADLIRGAQQMHIRLGLRFRRRRFEVDQLRHPVVIDGRAAAVARQQRGGDAGDAGQQDLVERLFQHVEAGDADDGVHVAADDDLEDDGRALGDEHLVAEVLGLDLEVGHGAGAALLAVEAELVVVGGAALGVLEAVRQQQQAPLEIDGLDLLAPELVGEADHREAEILLAEAHAFQQVLRHFLKDWLSEQAGAVERLADAGGLGADLVAQLARLGHDLEMGGAGTLFFFLDLGVGVGESRHGRYLKECVRVGPSGRWRAGFLGRGPKPRRRRLSGTASQNTRVWRNKTRSAWGR